MQEQKKKKKKWPWIVGAIVVIGIIGSQANKDGAGKPSTPSGTNPSAIESEAVTDAPTTTEKAEEVFGVGSTQVQKDVTVHLVGITHEDSPNDDKEYVLVEFEIENNSKKDITVSSLMSFELYVDGYSANTSISSLMSTDKKQLDGTVGPGKKMNGVIGVEPNDDWQELEVIFKLSAFGSSKMTFVIQNGD